MNLNSGESLILGGSLKTIIQRRSAGVVERAALEMRCTGNGTGGSNPSFSVLLYTFIKLIFSILVESRGTIWGTLNKTSPEYGTDR